MSPTESLETRNLLSGSTVFPGGASDSNDEISEATALTIGTVSGTFGIDPSNDVDMFSFVTTTTNQRVGIDLDRINGDLDSFLRVFNSNGTEIGTNDDGTAPGESFSLDSYLAIIIPNPGTYYFGISDLGNNSYDPITGTDDVFAGGTGDYTVIVEDIGDENDAISEANSLMMGVPDNRFILQDNPAGGEDVEMFSFTATAGQMIGIDVDTPNSNLDSVLRLFNSSGTELAFSDDAAGPGEEFGVFESF